MAYLGATNAHSTQNRYGDLQAALSQAPVLSLRLLQEALYIELVGRHGGVKWGIRGVKAGGSGDWKYAS